MAEGCTQFGCTYSIALGYVREYSILLAVMIYPSIYQIDCRTMPSKKKANKVAIGIKKGRSLILL